MLNECVELSEYFMSQHKYHFLNAAFYDPQKKN